MAEIGDIALFDLDGTLCDYEQALERDLKRIASPGEPQIKFPLSGDSPTYLRERANLIRKDESWWENLPRFQLGWDILKIAEEFDYRIISLTQGPRQNPAAWSGKKKWLDKNRPDTDIIITRDKGLVYGKVLVDDFPGYIDRWLTWRKRGLVIMPASSSNQDYKRHQVIRYDGNNLGQVREAMQKAKHRLPSKSL